MERSLPRNESSTGANVPRNESSWNVRSRGTKVPREQKFQGANVPWNESSTGAKVFSVDFSLPGTKVQTNEKAWNPVAEGGRNAVAVLWGHTLDL